MKIVTAMMCATCLLACGSNDDDDRGGELLVAPPEGRGIQLSMATAVEAGEEKTTCRVIAPAGEPLRIGRFEHRYTQGSHHMLVLRGAPPPEVVGDEPFECSQLNISEVVYAAQTAEGEMTLPDGVALTLGTDLPLILQTHYLNATDHRLQADARVNLWTVEDATIEAGTLFLYDWAIVVPAGGEATARMRCEIPEDVTLLAGMSHMHRRGVGYEATLDRANGGASEVEPETLFATTAWEDVVFDQYEPQVAISAGDAIEFHCDYRNHEDRAIIEGPSADANEMCMFIGLYYPKLGPDVEACLVGDSGPVRAGTMTCGQALGCEADDELGAEQCSLDVCAASSSSLNAVANCQIARCGAECNGGGDCQACMMDACSTELTTCFAAGCE